MLATRSSRTRFGVLSAALALAVLGCEGPTGSLSAQDVDGFRSELRGIDPQRSVILKVERVGSSQSSLAALYVTDGWYYLPCFKRQRFAKTMRRLWREHGGSNIVVNDRAGETVADFKVFSSDFSIDGCD